MALRQIRIQGDAILEKKCREITEMTPRIKELIEDMLDTMYDANGVGLAGPQVGVLKRIAVIDIGEGPVVLINPVIERQMANRPVTRAAYLFPEKQDRSRDQIMWSYVP